MDHVSEDEAKVERWDLALKVGDVGVAFPAARERDQMGGAVGLALFRERQGMLCGPPDTATKLFNAAAASNIGNQTVTPSFKLAVPAKFYAGTYTSTWTVTLSSGP
jgi:hypothetical protein